MLNVFVHQDGSQQGVEVRTEPRGQTLASGPDGRRAHLWWDSQDLKDREPEVYQMLAELVPQSDRVLLWRRTNGDRRYQIQCVVTDAGADDKVVTLSALEVRSAPEVVAQPVPKPATSVAPPPSVPDVGAPTSFLTLHQGAVAPPVSLGQAFG